MAIQCDYISLPQNGCKASLNAKGKNQSQWEWSAEADECSGTGPLNRRFMRVTFNYLGKPFNLQEPFLQIAVCPHFKTSEFTRPITRLSTISRRRKKLPPRPPVGMRPKAIFRSPFVAFYDYLGCNHDKKVILLATDERGNPPYGLKSPPHLSLGALIAC